MKPTDFVEYGQLKLPDDFPKALPFDLFRDFDGKIKHNFDFEVVKNGYPNVYLNGVSGTDSHDGLSEATAVQTLAKAMAIADGLPADTVNVFFMEKFIPCTALTGGASAAFTLSKNINLLSAQTGGTYITTAYRHTDYTWTKERQTYQTGCSSVYKVYDYKHKDLRGHPRELKQVNSLEENNVQPGTWFADGELLRVHRLDGLAPDADLTIIVPSNVQLGLHLNGFKLYMEKINFWLNQPDLTASSVSISGNPTSDIIINQCSAAMSRKNGFEINKFRNCYVFDSVAFDCGYDGFNYHGTSVPDPSEFVFEYYCYSYNHGHVVKGTGNATSAHNGMSVIRIGAVGHDTVGPVLADVNGCDSLNIDCTMYNSLRSPGRTKAAFYFDEAAAVKKGKAWLINCRGGGTDTFTVNTDGKTQVEVRNLHELK
ncbi:MAG: hypothetical protein K0Q59_3944 [Paenibacillus sp.]|jgi:hypothetical protein|nr:hypothetical protein [Paenibacillus sp.]